jgi:hypothetical protein
MRPQYALLSELLPYRVNISTLVKLVTGSVSVCLDFSFEGPWGERRGRVASRHHVAADRLRCHFELLVRVG